MMLAQSHVTYVLSTANNVARATRVATNNCGALWRVAMREGSRLLGVAVACISQAKDPCAELAVGKYFTLFILHSTCEVVAGGAAPSADAIVCTCNMRTTCLRLSCWQFTASLTDDSRTSNALSQLIPS